MSKLNVHASHKRVLNHHTISFSFSWSLKLLIVLLTFLTFLAFKTYFITFPLTDSHLCDTFNSLDWVVCCYNEFSWV